MGVARLDDGDVAGGCSGEALAPRSGQVASLGHSCPQPVVFEAWMVAQ
jgi:hypothetical protein